MSKITIDRAVVEQAMKAMLNFPGDISDEMFESIRALRAALAGPAQEPVDVGLLEYRGNSVAFIHQKMTAYRVGIDAAWDALRAKGLHPDGKTSLANMIAKYTAPPQRQPLTEKEMYIVEEEARKNFRLAQAGPRGQMITYWDSLTPWLIRAVERAHGIKE